VHEKYILIPFEGPKTGPEKTWISPNISNDLPALRAPTAITPGEWNVLVNPLHPKFSLKWVVSGPDTYTFDARLLPVKKGIRSRRTLRDQ
jgi:RES domain-containing protein